MNERPFNILLIEDDEDHAMLIERSFRRVSPRVVLRRVDRGDAALAMLRESDGTSALDLVLLDLRLPGMSGHSVLEQLKANPKTRQVPVLILSTSRAPMDRRLAYDAHANSYLIKPLDPQDLNDLAYDVVSYWASRNEPGVKVP